MTGVYFPPDVKAWLKEAAAKENRSMSNFLACLVKREMESEKEKTQWRKITHR